MKLLYLANDLYYTFTFKLTSPIMDSFLFKKADFLKCNEAQLAAGIAQ